ncbi:MAG: GNAT family N-acetyltransferase [Microscillaceae bacterium]|nr:GNAT family N-acetyltransferase [Microscillaceae bacterium]
MIRYTTAQNDQDLRQILDLQQLNREIVLTQENISSQGFVTVSHDFETLKAMNQPYPHIIAKHKDQVIGYTLVMLREFGDKIPVLIPMFEMIESIEYQGENLNNTNFFVMGQVCVASEFRGQGVFAGLYQEMKNLMAPHFKYIITEVALRNTRSMRAHEKVGFQNIYEYSSGGEDWAIILWEW